MKISLSYLEHYIALTETNPQTIVDTLTEKTAEVEEIINTAKDFNHVVVGKILDISSHPDADKVRVTQVDIGREDPLQIICGAKNIAVGQHVPVALVGAVLPGDFAIAQRKMRGVMSCGMICAENELGLADTSAGIMVLPENTTPGMPLAEALDLGGIVLDIDNTSITNRPDLFSHIGFAREFVALGLGTWKNKEHIFDFSGIETHLSEDSFPITFTIESPEICPARANVIVQNIQISPSPQWMQKRLQECGIRPINNIVDVSNIVMIEMGMPLHIFDRDTISGDTITMRTSREGEKVTTLDGMTRELPAGVILQEDRDKIFDLAGIMGGENSEITEETTTVLVHVPVYDPIHIRKAALALHHRTDASTIYEKHVPNASVLPGMLRTLTLLKEVCPECIISSQIEYIEHVPSESRIISVPRRSIDRISDSQISQEQVQTILESLDFEILSSSEETLEIIVPPHRLRDITLPEDSIEEIVRIYGLNRLPEVAPRITMQSFPETSLARVKKKCADFLVSQGFFECLNFAFIGPQLLEQCGLERSDDMIEIKNPLSSDQSLMRQSLLPRLFENVAQNAKHKESFLLFEIGKVFTKTSQEHISETVHLAGVSRGHDFFAVKAILSAMFQDMNLPIRFCEARTPSPFSHQHTSILLGRDEIGSIQIPKKSLQNQFSLSGDSAHFSLNLSILADFSPKTKKIVPAPKFPEVEIDLSVLADKNTYACDILSAVKKIDPLLISTEVIEIFEGEGVPEGKKSVTLHCVLRSEEETLTTNTIDTLRTKILHHLEKKGFLFRF